MPKIQTTIRQLITKLSLGLFSLVLIGFGLTSSIQIDAAPVSTNNSTTRAR